MDLACEYSESLKYRELALKTNGTSKVLKAKWCYTQSCLYESKGGQDNHRKALEYSIGAYKLTNEIGSDKNVFFQYLILNRVYHQYGYLGKWKQALSYAKKDLEVLLDTLPVEHIRALRIFDDLDYIYTLQGDPEKVNDYYEKSHENFIWHDLNLVKLSDSANEDELEAWMNWADPKGLITPAPNGVTFLGGVNDMPAESIGYFTVDLEPGRYAFISEVPNTKSKGLFKTFEVVE